MPTARIGMDKYFDRILAYQLQHPFSGGPAIDELDGPLSSLSPQPPSLQELCLRRAVLQQGVASMPPMVLDLMFEYACRHNLLTPELLAASVGEVVNLSNYGRAGFSASDAVRQLAAAAPPLRTLLLSWCYSLQSCALQELLAVVGPQLRVLRLWKCSEIDDSCLQVIACHCMQLEDLDVRGCQRLSAAARAEVLGACKELERILLGMKLDDGSVQAAASLARLRVFDVPHSAAISSSAVVGLGRCRHLATVNLSHAAIGRDSLRALAGGCRHLISLNLERCMSVDDDALCELAPLRSLEQLFLTGVPISERSLRALPRLRHLKVNECQRLNELPEACIPKEVLSAVQCSNLRHIAFGEGSTIRVLDLSMTLLGDSAASLPLACAEMRCLVVKKVVWLTSHILQAVIDRCKSTLQHFDMDQSSIGSFPSTDDIANLAQCPKLETLAFGGHLVGPSAFAALLRQCPRLTSIDSYCHALHKPDVQSGWSLENLMQRFGHFRFCWSTHDRVGVIIHRIQFNVFKHDEQDTRVGGAAEVSLAQPPEEPRDEEGHCEREARIAAAVRKRLESDEDMSEELKTTVVVLRMLNDNLATWLPKLQVKAPESELLCAEVAA